MSLDCDEMPAAHAVQAQLMEYCARVVQAANDGAPTVTAMVYHRKYLQKNATRKTNTAPKAKIGMPYSKSSQSASPWATSNHIPAAPFMGK